MRHLLLSATVGPRVDGLLGMTHYANRRVGVFAADTQDLHVVEPPADTADVDSVHAYEAAKWCKDALRCDPVVTSVMWAPVHDDMTELGRDLLDIRQAFLSRSNATAGYLGAASALMDVIKARLLPFSEEDQVLVSDTAQEMLRLLWQGYQLVTRGALPSRVDDLHRFRAFGQRVAAGYVSEAEGVLAMYRDRISSAKSPLPLEPDYEAVDRWMRFARLRFL